MLCPPPGGVFPTQGSKPGLPHCRWILYLGSPPAISPLLLSGESDRGHPREHLRHGKVPDRVGVIPATPGCLQCRVNRVEDPHCLALPTLSLVRDQRRYPRSGQPDTHARACSQAQAGSFCDKGQIQHQVDVQRPRAFWTSEGQSPCRQTPQKTMSALLEPSVYHVCLCFRALLY